MYAVFRWLGDDDPAKASFRQNYAHARVAQAHTLAEETLEIADDGRNDYMESEDPNNPGYRLNGENIQRSTLRANTRKWYASKMLPKVYGDKLGLEHTGKDGGPIRTEPAYDYSRLTKDERRTLMDLLAKAAVEPTKDAAQ